MAASTTGPEILVVGGGIAGLSAAAALTRHPSEPGVTVVEAEPTLAYHTTGRSAALYIENYGTGPMRVLTRATGPYLRQPPAELVDGPLIEPRGVLTVALPGQGALLDEALAEGRALNPRIDEVAVAEAVERFPALRPDRIERAMLEPDAADIDVGALHQSYVRQVRRSGGTIATTTAVERLVRSRGRWEVTTTDGELGADLVVDAGGAWGDVVAERAGVAPIGLEPKRRTAFMIARPSTVSARAPLTAEVSHTRWYLKPDGDQILCSPADETPSEPCDARPVEIDIARAIDDLNEATTLGIRSIRSSWAGLRTFAPDRTIVIGPDPDEPSFIWCVGQGGAGIQTSAGAGQLVADLALDGEPGPSFAPEVTGLDFDPATLSPARFR